MISVSRSEKRIIRLIRVSPILKKINQVMFQMQANPKRKLQRPIHNPIEEFLGR
jgi:hypothetical protein